MITLITGSPGAGKTAWTVQELTRLPAQRKVYIHGIPELKIAHEPIYCRSDLCDLCQSVPPEKLENGYFVEDWPQWATHGSLIVIDEVQRIWRPLNAATKLPDGISRLETHRHSGLDFWLISQGPHLFHSNIRLLIGRHIHLLASWRGRAEYEFPECRQDLTRRSDAISRPYTLPAKVFGLYKSASVHTTLQRRLPLAVYILAAVLLLTGFLVYGAYTSISSKSEPVTVSNPPLSPPVENTDFAAHPSNALPAQTIDPKPPDFKPLVPGQPETAPAYAGLTAVSSAPDIMGCASTPDWCRCYTSQGSVYEMSENQCLQRVKFRIFNPYKSKKDVVYASNR